MRLFLDRFVRAARLDVELYKEVVADPKTLNQAWITVLIYCMAASWGIFRHGRSDRDQYRHGHHPDRMVYLGFFYLLCRNPIFS